ncbi:hypothetical protein CH252_18780 [Rhodococcus sp. 06-1477-1B]|nr:hypothetical protein CH252_18780 [Rhodococcus sp. 06-1477-1B]
MSIYRDRRPRVPDPYNPARTTWGPWGDAQTVTLDSEAFIAPKGSTRSETATRTQVLTEVSLFAPVGSDVLPGDRIRDGDATYFVNVRPAPYVSPFDGWEAGIEAPLEDREG